MYFVKKHAILFLSGEVVAVSSNKICINCGKKKKQQFIGLQHCECGISRKKGIGYFEHTPDMVFALERISVGKKTKQVPVVKYR
jgi:hypothetical protein